MLASVPGVRILINVSKYSSEFRTRWEAICSNVTNASLLGQRGLKIPEEDNTSNPSISINFRKRGKKKR